MAICTECNREVRGKTRRERCRSCYNRLLRELKANGPLPPVVGPSAFERVIARTAPAQGGCIVYTASLRKGYGVLEEGGKRLAAHRVVYLAMVGSIPADLHLDHTCHNGDKSCAGGATCIHRRCVNPAHLEPVTNQENNRRGQSRSALNAAKTHCPEGHAYTAENTIVRHRKDGRMYRRCRTCHRDKNRELMRAKRERAGQT